MLKRILLSSIVISLLSTNLCVAILAAQGVNPSLGTMGALYALTGIIGAIITWSYIDGSRRR